MAIAQAVGSDTIVWLAMDPYTGFGIGRAGKYIPNSQFMHNLLQTWMRNANENVGNNYSVTILKHVMRCSESIFQAVYSKIKWLPGLQPVLGHKIVGVPVTEINQHYRTFDTARIALWDQINKVVGHLFQQGFAANDISIIVSTSSTATSALSTFLREQCQKCWPEFPNESFQAPAGELLPETELDVNNNPVLIVEKWQGVSSREWPVVVYASCLSANLEPAEIEQIAYQRYRSLTRASIKLIEISITYERDDLQEEESPKLAESTATKTSDSETVNLSQWQEVANSESGVNVNRFLSPLIKGWDLEKKGLGQIEKTAGCLDITMMKEMRVAPKLSGSDYYHNCATLGGKKGPALLINNQALAGSKIDFANMKNVLEALGYAVKETKLEADTLQTFIEEFGKGNPCHSCVVYLSTYANEGQFIDSYGNNFEMKSFFKEIVNCKALIDKPKVFIVQACREPAILGENEDASEIKAKIKACEWKSQENFLRNLSKAKDTFILHSTTPG